MTGVWGKGAAFVLTGAALLVAGCADERRAPTPPQPARDVACRADSGPTGAVPTVAAQARTFAAALDTHQRAVLSYALTKENAVKWSNLPVPAVPRIGVRLGDLDSSQKALARSLIASATSACGLKMFDDIRDADDYISPIIPMFGWTSDNYYVAFLGEPSARAPWMLKIGGHHIAYNFTFNARLPGATPLFNGTEPITFSFHGALHEPMALQSGAMRRLATGVAGYPEAKLAGRFTDVVKGVEVTLYPDRPPVGGNDTGFPSPYPTGNLGRGVSYAKLDATQKLLVRQAIEAYAALPAATMATPLVHEYEREDMLAHTYVGFANAPDLSVDGSYVRIDGPRIWLEFVVQPGVAYPRQLHYHALWRDKLADYGGQFFPVSAVRAALLFIALLTLTPLGASAHPMPNSAVYLDFGEGQVGTELVLPTNELRFAIGEDLAGTDALTAGQRTRLRHYIAEHFGASSMDGRLWQVSLERLLLSRGSGQPDVIATLRLVPPAGASARIFALRDDLITEAVPSHVILIFARSDLPAGKLSEDPVMIGAMQNPVAKVSIDRSGAGRTSPFAAAFILGARHIAEGTDHLLFLLTLLLPAPLLAYEGRWRARRSLRGTLLHLAAIVSAFTVGHSVTLVLGAALHWRVPAQPVEVAIALSIVFAALQAWRPFVGDREPLIAGVFGLIHGMSFAAVIGQYILEPVARMQVIGGFNLGIEAIQLLIVCCATPLLLLLSRFPAYRWLRPGLATCAAAAALYWAGARLVGI